MSVEVNVEDYDTRHEGVDEATITARATITEDSRIEFSYDGGRVSVTVDGVEVYSCLCHSHDVSVSVSNGPEYNLGLR